MYDNLPITLNFNLIRKYVAVYFDMYDIFSVPHSRAVDVQDAVGLSSCRLVRYSCRVREGGAEV